MRLDAAEINETIMLVMIRNLLYLCWYIYTFPHPCVTLLYVRLKFTTQFLKRDSRHPKVIPVISIQCSSISNVFPPQ